MRAERLHADDSVLQKYTERMIDDLKLCGSDEGRPLGIDFQDGSQITSSGFA